MRIREIIKQPILKGKYEPIAYHLVIITTALLAWYKVFRFWFFRGWETSWFWGVTGGRFTFVNLLRSHGFIYLLNYKLFGWNPTGWYLTAFVFHLFASFLVFNLTTMLSGHRVIGFLTGLLFVANTTYNDIVTWGSFEGLYAVQMICFLLSLIFFFRFRRKRGVINLFFALFIFAIALLIRESGIMFIPILLVFDLLSFGKNLRKGKLSFLKIHLPFWVVAGGYLLFRTSFGGAPHDYIDAMVQLRINLWREKRYLAYLWRAIIAFGKFIPPHLVPYPLLNTLRLRIFRLLPVDFVRLYFFPLLGWVFYLVILKLWFTQREKKSFKILTFALSFWTIPTTFYSFVWSITDDVLQKDYGWNGARWTYYAFFGTSLFLVTFFWQIYQDLVKRFRTKKERIKLCFLFLPFFLLALNIFFLHRIEDEIYETEHKQQKRFYQTLLNNFKSLPSDFVFYLYPHAPGADGYLAEWYFLRKEFYPNLEETREDWAEGQMERVLEKIVAGNYNLSSIFFIYYDPKKGVVDQTSKVREWLAKQEILTFPLRRKVKGKLEVSIARLPPVEFPYLVEIRMRARAVPATPVLKEKMSFEQLKALASFSRERIKFLENTQVEVCATAGSRPGEPFYRFHPRHLIDGNLGSRSLWIADCRPAFVILDLGEVRKIKAFSFGNVAGSPGTPSNYKFYISQDKKNWQEMLKVSGNKEDERIDELEKPVEGRFVKMVIETTQEGAFTSLDELEVITEEGAKALRFYKKRGKLISDSQNLFLPELDFSWVKFSWETDPDNGQENLQTFYFPIKTDGKFHTYTFQIPDREAYNSVGQFLKRFVKKIAFDFGELPGVKVEYVKLKPKYPVF